MNTETGQLPKYLDIHQAAAFLGRTVKQVRGMVGRRDVAYVAVSARRLHFRREDLENVPCWIDAHQAARQLGVTVQEVRSLAARRCLPFVDLGPRRIRLRKEDLERFINSGVIRGAQ